MAEATTTRTVKATRQILPARLLRRGFIYPSLRAMGRQFARPIIYLMAERLVVMKLVCADCGCLVEKGLVHERCTDPTCCCVALPSVRKASA